MENEKKTIDESENKDVGIAITDSEIKRRLERFKMLIGNIRGTSRPEILPFNGNVGETNIKVAGYLNKDGWDKRNENIRRIYSTDGISPTIPTGQGGGVMPKIRAVLTPDRENKRQNGRRFKEPGEPSFTVTGQDIHGVMLRDGRDNRSCLRSGRTPEVGYEGYSIRRLTPIECERLQGFPDNWTEYGIDEKGERVKMSDTQRYKQMGNAVTTNVICAVGSQILNKENSE